MMNNNIEENYCSFEISKLLKEKGFNVLPPNTSTTDYVFGYVFDEEDPEDILNVHEFQWEDSIQSHKFLRPTHALAINWIRENFGFHIYVAGWGFSYTPTITPVSELAHKKLAGNMKQLVWTDSNESAVDAALLYTLKKLI